MTMKPKILLNSIVTVVLLSCASARKPEQTKMPEPQPNIVVEPLDQSGIPLDELYGFSKKSLAQKIKENATTVAGEIYTYDFKDNGNIYSVSLSHTLFIVDQESFKVPLFYLYEVSNSDSTGTFVVDNGYGVNVFQNKYFNTDFPIDTDLHGRHVVNIPSRVLLGPELLYEKIANVVLSQ